MLNLIDPIRYTEEEKAHVNDVLKPLKEAGWKDQKDKTKSLKNRISEHTIIAQGCRCAYCESMLLRGSHAIEHIAPKGRYGDFCFEPFNLVTACTSCNSTSNKGETDTVKDPVNKSDYTANRFKMVHPYFDNPKNHFKYMDDDETMFDKTNCSPEALFTINMMHWDEQWAYRQRVVNAMSRDLKCDVLKVVAEIVTYR